MSYPALPLIASDGISGPFPFMTPALYAFSFHQTKLLALGEWETLLSSRTPVWSAFLPFFPPANTADALDSHTCLKHL